MNIGNCLHTIKRIWSKRSPESWLDYLRSEGMRIGTGTKLFSKPSAVLIDLTRPWLIEIGKNVQITIGVKILTHGYDWSVLKGKYGEVLGSAGKVTIGDNCFIGMNTVILKGTTIGNNTIIGAGSVVTGGYPSDCVIAGNPAKVICSLDEYREKRQKAQLSEERVNLGNNAFIGKMKCVNNYEVSLETFLNGKPLFHGYDSFIEYALKNGG